MTSRLLALLLLLPAVSFAGGADVYPHSADFHPNKSFVPVRLRGSGVGGAATIQQVGEVVIIEGDEDLVSSDGMGGWGIVADGNYAQQVDITNRFFEKYADEFDEIILFTTFSDTGAMGASAYEMSVQNKVKGIGRAVFDNTSFWGAEKKKLTAFVNMMRIDTYEGYGVALTSPDNWLYAVIGQEFGHGWLSFMSYIDANGVKSMGLLGRDESHWASTLQAYASVLDGNEFSAAPDGDGYYSVVNSNARFSPLDLYGMGLIPASEVPPFFLIKDAVTATGRTVNPANPIRSTTKLKGTREDITIEQVVASEGPRIPSSDNSQHGFRVAFVLLTRPGETAAQVIPTANKLNEVRKVWEQQFGEMTGGKGTMCTQVSAPCGAPTAHIGAGLVAEAGGNHNNIAEPGEPVLVTFDISNDAAAPAQNVLVKALGDVVAGVAPAEVAELAPAGVVSVPFMGQIPPGAQCGVPLTIEAESVVDGHTFRGFARVTPGLTSLWHESFETDDAFFTVNRDGSDTVTMNGWSYGTPTEVRARYGYLLQPSSGHESQKGWFTGLQGGPTDMVQSYLGVGTSTLTSTPIDVSSTYLPVLRYYAWYLAIDYTDPMSGGEIADGVSLLVEGSADRGQTWVMLDEVTGASTRWREREVPLDGKLPLDKAIMLRFTVSNSDPNIQVEAGIDDLQITTLTSACNPSYVAPEDTTVTPPKSGGCAYAPGGAPAGLLGLVAVMIFAGLALRRRRAR
jgi:MYXO-CTERM domain-containing protein